MKVLFCVGSLCSIVACNALIPSLSKCGCGIVFSLFILCHACLKALKDAEPPKQVLAEQITVLLSCSVPRFPHGKGENFIIWKLCRNAGSDLSNIGTKLG